MSELWSIETDLIQRHQILLKMIEEVQDCAIILLDLDGNIQNWNLGAQRIKGYDEDEVIGKNISIFYTESDQEKGLSKNLLKKAKLTGRASDSGWRVRKDGSHFWGNIIINAVHDERGNLIGFGKLTRDLTENRKAARARDLEIKNKELEQFVYIASHDLQEPLRTVSNYIEVIQEDYEGQLVPQVLDYLKTIDLSTKRMSILIRALLDYSRLGYGAEIKRVDCEKILADVITDLENIIQSTNTSIKYEAELPQLNGFEMELRQLFQNIISNAIKFRKKDLPLEIKIGCEKINQEWQISISDNGIGIDSKNFERIFNIFQRLDEKKEYIGYGIGLANCKKIVELHGGKIWIESELGIGSTFYFTLIN